MSETICLTEVKQTFTLQKVSDADVCGSNAASDTRKRRKEEQNGRMRRRRRTKVTYWTGPAQGDGRVKKVESCWSRALNSARTRAPRRCRS